MYLYWQWLYFYINLYTSPCFLNSLNLTCYFNYEEFKNGDDKRKSALLLKNICILAKLNIC